MIIYPIVTSQPDTEPVTLDEAKQHLEYDGDRKDDMINRLITTARQACESYAGLSFVTQERSIRLDRFPCNRSYVYLPYGPVQAVISAEYIDTDGDTVTMVEGTDYEVAIYGGVARFYPITDGVRSAWPSDVDSINEAITIVYQTGYDSVSGLPLPGVAKQSILMVLTRLFENRGDQGTKDGILTWDVQTMLDTIKVTWNADYN
jgi:uncharacterized phiE125 gp8 family phage protein